MRRGLSKNRVRNLLCLQCLHPRWRNILNDFLHKVTTGVARAKRVYVMEDLSVQSPVQGRRHGFRLLKAISKATRGEFTRGIGR